MATFTLAGEINLYTYSVFLQTPSKFSYYVNTIYCSFGNPLYIFVEYTIPSEE